jgi:hypothetical protein
MSDRLQSNLGLIRTLVERAPDRVLADLEGALGGQTAAGALSAVREMVEGEAADRRARDMIFSPVKPLFGPRRDGVAQLCFPAPAFARLWRAVKAAAPAEATAAAFARPDEGVPPPQWDALCTIAAAQLRSREHREFAGLAEALDADGSEGAIQLAGCLDLVPLARVALARAPEWLQRMTEDRAVTVRLTYRDAVAIAEDGGPRLLEMVFAHLSEPWVILRLLAAVMGRPADNYISSSELAGFCLRLLDEIDRRLDILRTFDLDGGEEAAATASAHLAFSTAIADEFEQVLNLAKEGPWGARLSRQKAASAKLVEGFLKKADSVLATALPTTPIKIGGRTVRTGAKLDSPPDMRAMRRARAVTTLIERCRPAAQIGGFSSLRSKACEEVEHRLNAYVEDLLLTIHDGEAADVANARLYMEEAACLMGHVRDAAAAQIVRRRAAAA